MNGFFDALLLSGGYNAALVTLGAALLGFSAGTAGTFLFLRKRALVSDAVAHATLPGVGMAFIVMVALGGEGRNLAGLLAGSAITATLGLLSIMWISRYTRLSEDAAIGAILSVFFGIGIVLLTVIQSISSGRQAGLEDFLLGATASMLFQDAVIIAAGGIGTALVTLILRRPMALVAFDADYATASGYNIARIDFAMMALVMAVTVIGLKIVGLIMVVALLIIPAVTARFWTERVDRVVWIASIIGALAGYLGAALSASAPALPAGPIIVLVSAALFIFSLFFSPLRGIAAAAYQHWKFQKRVHLRQGLLALARAEVIHDALTLATLRRAGFIRKDGVATESGRAQAAKAARDEHRWEIARRIHHDTALTGRYDGLTPIETVFTHDEIAEFDRIIGKPYVVS
ncbi:MAG: metal ABC transporter permease [Pseudomonadota bacterium]